MKPVPRSPSPHSNRVVGEYVPYNFHVSRADERAVKRIADLVRAGASPIQAFRDVRREMPDACLPPQILERV